MAARPRVEGHLNVYFAVACVAVTVAAPDPAAQFVALGWFLALGVDAAGRRYLALLRVPVSFLLPSLVVVLVATAGPPLVRLGPLTVTETGFHRTATAGLRSMASLSILGYLVVTTPVPALVGALERVRLPAFAVEFILLTYRTIQLLLDESVRLRVAVASRLGFRNRRTLFRSTKLVALSLFLTSLSRAETMETAMSARGYRGEMPSQPVASGGYPYVAVVLATIVSVGWFL